MLSIIIPAHNEEGSIAAVVREFYDAVIPRWPGSELIVVNDRSTDRTPAIVEELQRERPALRLLTPSSNLGHGGSVRFGFAHARADWVFYTDGDYQTRAGTLVVMLQELAAYDYQAGFRPRRGDGLQREIVTGVLRFVIRAATGSSVRDANCPYKLMPRRLWAELDPLIPADSPAPMACLEALIAKLPLRTRLLPVSWHERVGGKASMTGWMKFARAGLRTTRDLRRMQRLDLGQVSGVHPT